MAPRPLFSIGRYSANVTRELFDRFFPNQFTEGLRSIYAYFEKLAKTDLLILDDFGLTFLEKQHQVDFMELIEDRHNKKSTIIASQLPIANWYDVIGEENIAEAVLDRLVHTSYKIEMKGDSMRKKK